MESSAKPIKRLYRSRKERVIAGVCGGIGEYFEVDPILVRLAFFLFFLAVGGGLLAYLVIWLFLPLQNN